MSDELEEDRSPKQANRVKYQHYIPRLYLKNFCNSEGRVWVYDKKLAKAYARTPDNIGGETYFYDVPELEKEIGVVQFVERFFNDFEDCAARVLTDWLDQLRVGGDFQVAAKDRADFSLYLATQLVRTPNYRKFTLQMGAAILKVKLEAHIAAEAPDETVDIKWRKEREAAFHARHILDLDTLETYAQIFHSHVWIFLRNPTGRSLYTSDNPILLKTHKRGERQLPGIGAEGIELIFPIAPNFSLSLLERSYWSHMEKFDGLVAPFNMADTNIDHDNSGHANQSTRFVYCRDDDFSLARRFCAEYPDVTDPERQIISKA
jgi:Protein of unknown function (DUF4238)